MAFLRYPEGREPDYDRSGVIDRSDLDILVEARNQPAGPGDPRDLDRDGGITALDARKLVLRCDYSRCASGAPPQNEPEVFFIHTDQLGTPRLLSNRDQAIVWRWDSDPFGTTPASEDPDGDGQPLVYNGRFPGQYFDGETGLHYNYFRDYDPSSGRYIESDPIGLAGGLNTYAYVGGNPLSFIDPLGLECTAVNGTVTCNVPGGPQISFPQPAGWPSSLKPGDSNYHYYNKWVNLPPGVDKQCVEEYLKNHPTPGSPSPATPEGTPNDASPNWAAPFKSSSVQSYTMTSNGSPVVVNVTLPGHPLFPGYVARDVSGGVVNNFGEGTGWLQGPNSPFSGPINNVWYGLTDDAIKACSCQQ